MAVDGLMSYISTTSQKVCGAVLPPLERDLLHVQRLHSLQWMTRGQSCLVETMES
ncbi:hypothetical protein GBAR_LOCUS22449 [Geodia barretti]|uniref:Uncharacterized protein n=1 Tax=Geodia barretti TaxID=519541 RepID=A0AA35T2H7_GEOBA|nr:hypothetical protein GBAR_LOCUS22449 [Geodia barretti]